MYKALERHQVSGQDSDLPRTGRKRSTTARDDRVLVRASLQNRKRTVPELCALWEAAGVSRSDSTVRRRLAEADLNAYRAIKKPLLTDRHKNLRLNFARAHQDWTYVDWSCVVWSDESKFNLFQSDGPVYVRRRAGEEFRADCVVPTVKFHGGNVMMWGAMTFRGTGFLKKVSGRLCARDYINILRDCAVPTAHMLGYGDQYWFQDDGAPCHRAKIVSEWKEEHDMMCLDWPPQSPDLNPIENLWGDIKRSLKKQAPSNLRELEANVVDIWNKIAVERCETLVRSMPSRITAVLQANGGYTKY